MTITDIDKRPQISFPHKVTISGVNGVKEMHIIIAAAEACDATVSSYFHHHIEYFTEEGSECAIVTLYRD